MQGMLSWDVFQRFTNNKCLKLTFFQQFSVCIFLLIKINISIIQSLSKLLVLNKSFRRVWSGAPKTNFVIVTIPTVHNITLSLSWIPLTFCHILHGWWDYYVNPVWNETVVLTNDTLCRMWAKLTFPLMSYSEGFFIDIYFFSKT